ncbi:biotin-dependent carboxyltransferase family protein [Paenibacillus terreus]|uniref:Biotin-dependent carboxyltransferase family protein n=1 Tax=Paenibacillus terreus TaxID=1387834 RepID=A0ABV5BC31_9BACL
MSLEVMRPGMLTSIQDLGRYGYQKHGVIVSGAMDTYALRAANLLVGNKEGEAALEMTLTGPSLKAGQDLLVAITGGDLSPIVDGQPVPMWRPVLLKAGSVLQLGGAKSGCRAYLAVAGGYAVPKVMGSKSTYLRAGLGGFQGRALQTGDVLEVLPPQEASLRIMRKLEPAPGSSFGSVKWSARERGIPGQGRWVTVRALRGSEYDHFDESSRQSLWEEPLLVTPQSDRMGYRLSGPVFKLRQPFEMISEAVTLGTVQVPPDGNPIILLADRQTAGGYPRIAQIAAADVPFIAQLKPGQRLKLREITREEAERLYLEREEEIHALKTSVNMRFM